MVSSFILSSKLKDVGLIHRDLTIYLHLRSFFGAPFNLRFQINLNRLDFLRLFWLILFEMVWIKFHMRFSSACATVEMCSTLRVWTIVGGWSLLNCFFKFLLFFPFFAYESDSSVKSLFNSFSWACIIDLRAFYCMVL
jgi:hypothetical protein